MNMRADYHSNEALARSAGETVTLFVNSSAVRKKLDELAQFSFVFEISAISFAIILNTFLVIGIIRSPRLQAPIFQLIMSIAASDLILALCATPRLHDYFAVDKEWILGRAGCAIFKFFEYVTPQVTGSLILVCCLERFYAVCRPASIHCGSARKMVVIIILIWIVNTGVCAPLLVHTALYNVHFADGFVMETCRVVLSDDVLRLFDTVTAMVFYALAGVTSALFLACTVCKAIKVDNENVKDDFKNHVLRCIVIITLVHFLLWLPQRVITLHNLHASGGKITSVPVVSLARLLIYLSSAVKPVVYLTASSRFRGALLRSLRCCKTTEFRYHAAATAFLATPSVSTERTLV